MARAKTSGKMVGELTKSQTVRRAEKLLRICVLDTLLLSSMAQRFLVSITLVLTGSRLLGEMFVFKDSGACLFGLDRVVGDPRPPLSGIGVPWVSLPTHRCALMPKVASRQSANPLWLLECGLVNVSWWSSKQGQRDFTALLLHAFRVPCLKTILDSWSLECENTYTPARRVALFC